MTTPIIVTDRLDKIFRSRDHPLLTTATPALAALLAPSVWMLLEGTGVIGVQLLIGAGSGADFSHANRLSVLVVALVSLSSSLSYGVLSAAFTLVF
jgi:hypothetical protein